MKKTIAKTQCEKITEKRLRRNVYRLGKKKFCKNFSVFKINLKFHWVRNFCVFLFLKSYFNIFLCVYFNLLNFFLNLSSTFFLFLLVIIVILTDSYNNVESEIDKRKRYCFYLFYFLFFEKLEK